MKSGKGKPGRPRKPEVAERKEKRGRGRPKKDRTGKMRLGGSLDKETHGQLKSRAALHRTPFEQYLEIVLRWYLIRFATLGTPPEEEPIVSFFEKTRERPKQDRVRLGGYFDESTHAQLKSRAALHRIPLSRYLETIGKWYVLTYASLETPPEEEPIVTLIDLTQET